LNSFDAALMISACTISHQSQSEAQAALAMAISIYHTSLRVRSSEQLWLVLGELLLC
jgi:hypothetical protein